MIRKPNRFGPKVKIMKRKKKNTMTEAIASFNIEVFRPR
jgi:hypothetical protein